MDDERKNKAGIGFAQSALKRADYFESKAQRHVQEGKPQAAASAQGRANAARTRAQKALNTVRERMDKS